MNLWNIGLDFKSAPMELRSRAAVSPEAFLGDLAPHWKEQVILSTCNRVEVYGVGSEMGSEVLKRWLDRSGMEVDLASHFRILSDQDALRHLLRVSSSLESMVVGETQITGQLKRAYEQSHERGTVGPILHKCFQRAFKVAKNIRAQTEVGRLAVSIPSIGVKLAEKVLGDLSHRSVGIVGTGEIGRVAAEHFASVQPRKLWIYNRTRSRAEELVTRLQPQCSSACIALDMETLVENVDALICAVDADILTEKHLRKMDDRGSSIFVLDLAVPARVPALDLSNVFTFFIDDLKKIASENSELRGQEVEKANEIISHEVRDCWRLLENLSVTQAFGRLANKIESTTSVELRHLRDRLSDVNDKDWREIEKMAFRLTSKIVQDPIMELKSQIETQEDSETFVEFFRSLFRI